MKWITHEKEPIFPANTNENHNVYGQRLFRKEVVAGIDDL